MHPSKYVVLITTLVLSFISINSSASTQSEAEIANRIAPVGSVYLDGDIKSTTKTPPEKSTEPRTGKQIYNTYCMACHASGALGAPLKGDAKAWKPRLALGTKKLYQQAISGFKGMPARGTCADCSDAEIKSAVDFIIK